jgi:NAD(P)-dependent dehydrogenase (short-subunit alcohol dehydrogenase family)
MQDVQGKVAFITGGASGIGLGIARALVNAGMKVVIGDLQREHLDQALAGFHGSRIVHGIQLDVTDRHAMARAADETERVFGKVHVLCNNAGIGIGGPMKLATYDDWDWIMGVNLGGVINGVQTFLPRMLSHGEGGHVVNTSSMSGILPHYGAGLYITTKFAVVGLSEALRTELRDEKVGVSVLCPGPVQTNIAQSGKTRPERFAKTGYAELDKTRQARSVSSLYMDPIKVGERVLEGIRRDDLYIFTHPEFRDGIRARCDAIMAAVPKEEPNPELVAAIGFLLSNPIYSKTHSAG